MLADSRYVGAVVETAEDLARLLDATENKLSVLLSLDTKSLRSELLRKLREDEIGEYDHNGLVADWLYYRAAVTDWAVRSSGMPERAPPTDMPDKRNLTEAAQCGLRRIWGQIAQLLSSANLVHWRAPRWVSRQQ
jgi:hypothetical protein